MSDMPERLLAWPSNHNYQRVSLAGGRPNDAVEYLRADAIPAVQPTVLPDVVGLLREARLMVGVDTLAGKLWHDAVDAALARVKGVM